MLDPTHPLLTDEPVICGVCRGRAAPAGWTPIDDRLTQLGRILWLCDHPECLELGQKAYVMPADYPDAYEELARFEAGTHAGEYLDMIGQTDMAKLMDNEWHQFLDILFNRREEALRRMIAKNEPPF